MHLWQFPPKRHLLCKSQRVKTHMHLHADNRLPCNRATLPSICLGPSPLALSAASASLSAGKANCGGLQEPCGTADPTFWPSNDVEWTKSQQKKLPGACTCNMRGRCVPCIVCRQSLQVQAHDFAHAASKNATKYILHEHVQACTKQHGRVQLTSIWFCPSVCYAALLPLSVDFADQCGTSPNHY